jgi:hypothetical protein
VPTNEINPNNAGSIKLAPAGITPLVEYGCQITNIVLEPSQNTTTRPGTYCGPPVDVPGKSSWAIVISFLQDWGFTPSLSKFTYDNDGLLCDFEFTSTNPATVPNMTGQAYVTATAFGGDPGAAWAVTTQRWACDDKPTIVAAGMMAAEGEQQTTDEYATA